MSDNFSSKLQTVKKQWKKKGWVPKSTAKRSRSSRNWESSSDDESDVPAQQTDFCLVCFEPDDSPSFEMQFMRSCTAEEIICELLRHGKVESKDYRLKLQGQKVGDGVILHDLDSSQRGFVTLELTHVFELAISPLEGDTFTIKVDMCFKVDEIKTAIELQTGISTEQQMLLYHGHVLKGFMTLIDYDVAPHEPLQLKIDKQHQIKLLMISGKEIEMTIKDSDTLNMLKAKVQYNTGIHWNQLRLVVDDEVLQGDETTMYDLKITDESVINIVRTSSFTVWVMRNRGQSIALEVQATDTVEDVKVKIFEKEGIPQEVQHLYVETAQLMPGQEMEDDRTLRDYDIDAQNYRLWMLV
jgi:ubiquitin C